LTLSQPGTVSLDSFTLAYQHTDYPTTGANPDPTLRGSLSGDLTGTTVQVSLDGGATPLAAVDVAPDGSFEYLPEGLIEGGSYAFHVRVVQWDPLASSEILSSWTEAPAVAFDFVPSLASAPEVTSLERRVPETSAVATTLAAFVGQVTGSGRVGGLIVRFDHNGDGVPDGQSITSDDGSFVY